eukprot:m.71137 g.71137  ORF g.71137 m.71137 type:complete len:422 (-) comp13804_c1_seq1:193-1458(-)
MALQWQQLLLLLVLYLVQGLPFGLEVKTLPILLRQSGASLSAISSLGILSLPWLCKLVWAPFVDSYYWPTFGRRKSWIVPCLLAIATTAASAMLAESYIYLMIAIFLMNLAASIQDVATDGLAIDILTSGESVAYGNSAQVVGFKIGMMLTGGLVPWLMAAHAWAACFGAIVLITLLVAVLCLRFSEPPIPADERDKLAKSTADKTKKQSVLDTVFSVYGVILEQLRQPASRPLLLLLVTYKAGELMADIMFKPFLLDDGIDGEVVSLWTGVYGSIFSILGSLTGGYFSGQFTALDTLLIFGTLRLVPQFGRAVLAMTGVSADMPLPALALIGVESVTGGVVTTSVFTIMMSHSQLDTVSSSSVATYYTALTAVELIGKNMAGFLSGVIAEVLGYPLFFMLTTALSVLPLWFARDIKLQTH